MSNVQLFLCLFLPITVVAKDYYGTKGSNITLICPFKAGSLGILQWTYLFNTSSLTVYSINKEVNKDMLPPAIYNRLSVTGNYAIGEYNLQIRDIQETDEGIYKCEVGSEQPDQQGLYLIVPPSSVNIENVTSLDRLLGTEGQDMVLSCVAVGGKPPPSIKLKVDGTTQVASTQSATYTLTSISRSYDRKIVTCEANVDTPKRDTALLYLNLKPLQPTFSSDPVSTEETKPFVASCTSYGSRPQATFKWMIGQTTITTNITTIPNYNTAEDTYTVTSTLTHNVDRTYNGQTVTCSAYNNASTSGVVASTTLDVKFAPNIIVTNVTYNQNTTNRTVTCIPVGNPTTYVYYRWQHKSTYGVLIRALDGGHDGVLTLHIVPVQQGYQDSGEYVCTASNGIRGGDGKIQQSGSGYVSVYDQPVFINGNKDTEYGEFGSDVTMDVYAYSVPKYTLLKWYKSNMLISETEKYTLSESKAMVTDTFHLTIVQLDGYRFTLTIRNLDESDFNVTYRVELYNGVGQTVRHATLLLSVCGPQTPINFTLQGSTESSIAVQWEAGYNGGHEQTFFLQFRRFESKAWVAVLIPDTRQAGKQTYTLSELQDGILFELRMYAENMFKKSLPTETKTIATIQDSRLSSSEAIIKSVAGGLSTVIFIMFIMIIALLLLWKMGNNRQKSKYSRWKEETAYNIPIDYKETDEKMNTVDKRGKHKKTVTESAEEYETLGMKDNPNTYSEILTHQDQKQSDKSAQEYEKLGDNPSTYSELNSRQGQRSDTTRDYYESLGDYDKSNTKNLKAEPSSEYTNIKI